MNDLENSSFNFEKMYRGPTQNRLTTCVTVDVAKDYMTPNVGQGNIVEMPLDPWFDKQKSKNMNCHVQLTRKSQPHPLESPKLNLKIVDPEIHRLKFQKGGNRCQKHQIATVKDPYNQYEEINQNGYYRLTRPTKYRTVIEGQSERINHDILLISCIDKKFVDMAVNYMQKRGLGGLYYEQTIPGASLGALQQWDRISSVLDFLDQSANLKQIIILDHEDCKWYKSFYSNPNLYNTDSVPDIHHQNLTRLATMLRSRYPIVEIGYIDTNGQVNMLDVNQMVPQSGIDSPPYRIAQPTTYPMIQPTTYPMTQPTTYPMTQPTTYPMTQTSTYPMTHSGIYPITQTNAYPMTQSGTYPTTPTIAYPMTHSGNYPMTQSGTYPMIHASNYPMNQSNSYPLAQTSISQQSNYPSGQSIYENPQTVGYPTTNPSILSLNQPY